MDLESSEESSVLSDSSIYGIDSKKALRAVEGALQELAQSHCTCDQEKELDSRVQWRQRREAVNIAENVDASCENVSALRYRMRQIRFQLALQQNLIEQDDIKNNIPNGPKPMQLHDDPSRHFQISVPQHFTRRDRQRHLSSGVTPWEGSQYMLSLLISLSKKLLQKYCFLTLRDQYVMIRTKRDIASLMFSNKCKALLGNIFCAWKLSWLQHRHHHIAMAQGRRHHYSKSVAKVIRRMHAFKILRGRRQSEISMANMFYKTKVLKGAWRFLWESLIECPRRRKKRLLKAITRPHTKHRNGLALENSATYSISSDRGSVVLCFMLHCLTMETKGFSSLLKGIKRMKHIRYINEISTQSDKFRCQRKGLKSWIVFCRFQKSQRLAIEDAIYCFRYQSVKTNFTWWRVSTSTLKEAQNKSSDARSLHCFSSFGSAGAMLEREKSMCMDNEPAAKHLKQETNDMPEKLRLVTARESLPPSSRTSRLLCSISSNQSANSGTSSFQNSLCVQDHKETTDAESNDGVEQSRLSVDSLENFLHDNTLRLSDTDAYAATGSTSDHAPSKTPSEVDNDNGHDEHAEDLIDVTRLSIDSLENDSSEVVEVGLKRAPFSRLHVNSSINSKKADEAALSVSSHEHWRVDAVDNVIASNDVEDDKFKNLAIGKGNAEMTAQSIVSLQDPTKKKDTQKNKKGLSSELKGIESTVMEKGATSTSVDSDMPPSQDACVSTTNAGIAVRHSHVNRSDCSTQTDVVHGHDSKTHEESYHCSQSRPKSKQEWSGAYRNPQLTMGGPHSPDDSSLEASIGYLPLLHSIGVATQEQLPLSFKLYVSEDNRQEIQEDESTLSETVASDDESVLPSFLSHSKTSLPLSHEIYVRSSQMNITSADKDGAQFISVGAERSIHDQKEDGHDVIVSRQSSLSANGVISHAVKVEVERRFRYQRLKQVVAYFRKWKRQIRALQLLRRVFGHAMALWENRYNRRHSMLPFHLLRHIVNIWKFAVSLSRERRRKHNSMHRALMFRGLVLLTRSFLIWSRWAKQMRRKRKQVLSMEKMTKQVCFLGFVMLLQHLQVRYDNARAHHVFRMKKLSFLSLRENCSIAYQQERILSSKVKLLQLKNVWKKWSLKLRESLLRRKLERYIFSKEMQRKQDCFLKWEQFFVCLKRQRIFSSRVVDICIRYKAKRIFLSWPGRVLSIKASELRRKHVRNKKRLLECIKGKPVPFSLRNKAIPSNLIHGAFDSKFNEENDSISVTSSISFDHSSSSEQKRHSKKSQIPIFFPTGGRNDKIKPQIHFKTFLGEQSWPRFQPSYYKNYNFYEPDSGHSQVANEASKENIESKSYQKIDDASTTMMGVSFQKRAMTMGYSNGGHDCKVIVALFMQEILQHWRLYSKRHKAIRKLGMFLQACTKLRQLSRLFYHWLVRSSTLAHRQSTWICPNQKQLKFGPNHTRKISELALEENMYKLRYSSDAPSTMEFVSKLRFLDEYDDEEKQDATGNKGPFPLRASTVHRAATLPSGSNTTGKKVNGKKCFDRHMGGRYTDRSTSQPDPLFLGNRNVRYGII